MGAFVYELFLNLLKVSLSCRLNFAGRVIKDLGLKFREISVKLGCCGLILNG